jgi:hypothetical protein
MCPDLVANKTSRWNAKGPVNGKHAEIARIQHKSCWARSPGVGFDYAVSVGNLLGFPPKSRALGGFPESYVKNAEERRRAR